MVPRKKIDKMILTKRSNPEISTAEPVLKKQKVEDSEYSEIVEDSDNLRSEQSSQISLSDLLDSQNNGEDL